MHQAALLLVALLCGCDVVYEAFLRSPEPDGAAPDAAPDAAAPEAGMDLRSVSPLCDDKDPTLVLCLGFEGNLSDLSRNRLQPVGSPQVTFAAGAVGSGAELPGPTPFALPPLPAWDAAQYTLEVWVNLRQLPGEGQRFGLFDHTGRYGVFLYGPTAGGTASATLECSYIGQRFRGPSLKTGTWQHLACATDGMTMTLYLDGLATQRYPLTASVPVTTTNGTHVGSDEPSGNDRLPGALDELRFFSRVRSDAEIAEAAGRRSSSP